MDLEIFTDESNSVANKDEWLLVQYEKDTKTFIRKIVKSNEIVWNKQPETIAGNEPQHDRVFIRDGEKIFLGDVIHKSVNEEDALRQNQLLQDFCMQVLHSSHDLNAILKRLQFAKDMWFLVMYTSDPMTRIGCQCVFRIFNNEGVTVKRDCKANFLVAFVHEKESTYKGIVIKASYDLKHLRFAMDLIKTNVRGACIDENIGTKKKNLELRSEISEMERSVHDECILLTQALDVMGNRLTRSRERLAFLVKLAKLNNLKISSYGFNKV